VEFSFVNVIKDFVSVMQGMISFRITKRVDYWCLLDFHLHHAMRMVVIEEYKSLQGKWQVTKGLLRWLGLVVFKLSLCCGCSALSSG
jgi:hypothetical protein